MLPINIDISDVLLEFDELVNRADEMKQTILQRMTEEFMFSWENKISKELHSTRQEYRKAMFVEQENDNTIVLGLLASRSNLAIMLEGGANSFDMKKNFMQSEKAVHYTDKKGKQQWYLTIPFRHATSGAIGESMLFSNKMPIEIEKIAKQKSPESVSLQDLPEQYRRIGINKTSGYKHKSPIFEGLVRKQISSTTKENRGGYMTFRRVGSKSEQSAFVHPGLRAKKFLERTANELNYCNIVDEVLQKFLDTL